VRNGKIYLLDDDLLETYMNLTAYHKFPIVIDKATKVIIKRIFSEAKEGRIINTSGDIKEHIKHRKNVINRKGRARYRTLRSSRTRVSPRLFCRAAAPSAACRGAFLNMRKQPLICCRIISTSDLLRDLSFRSTMQNTRWRNTHGNSLVEQHRYG